MSRLAIAAIVAICVIACLSTPVKKPFKGIAKHRMVFGRKSHGLVPPPDAPKGKSAKVPEQFFDQPVDNFDASNTNTWRQRYWYNDQWYQPGGPQFLMIGGESGENPYWVESGDLEWTTLAQQNKAIVFLLEHRFYGSSQPTNDMSVSSLKYLSSEQALADLNNFITAMNGQFNFTSPRWITFGGSYSGALAAWSRQMYPNNVYAAVGSSGPVQAVVDFTGYLEVVQNALQTYSQDCADSLQKGLGQVNDLMKTSDGQKQVTQIFNVCEDLSSANSDQIAYFYENIIGNYMGIVQYSQDNVGQYADELTIPAICKIQTDTSKGDDMARVAAVTSWLSGGWCTDIDYDGYIDYLKSAEPGTDAGDYRAWIWQTCSEFGFYQSTDSTRSFYGDVMPVDYYVKQCAQIYSSQYDNSTVYAAIDATNQHYLGQTNYNGTKVILPNGTNDPWHVLGILTAPNDKVYPAIIDGTSHCADMYPPGPNDRDGLTRARQAVTLHVNTWVNE